MNREYLAFAAHNLKRRKLRSWLTMIGIFIGIAAVVSLIGLGEGLRAAIVSQFGFLGTDVLSVRASGLDFAGPPGQAASNPLQESLVDKISRVRNVEASISRYIESGTVEFNGKQNIGIITSVPEGDKRKILEGMVNLQSQSGRLLKDSDNKKVLIGNDYTKDDTFDRSISQGDQISINNIQFEVVGILEKKGSFIFDQSIFMNERVLLDLFGDEGVVDIIAIKVKDENQINQVKEDVEKLLRKERDVKIGEEDFRVESPQRILESLNSTLFGIQLFVYVIALISILVGGIGVMNTMYTSVLERTKEIGVMKSIGATNRTIFTLFFIESGLLGMVGGVVGVIIGIIGSHSLAAVGRVALGSDFLQAKIGLTLIIGSLLFSFIVGTIAGILPATQAARMQPVDALRYGK
jgi:putative ABC transport system permease protein